MDVPQTGAKPNPVEKATFISRWLFIWFWPIFRIGSASGLTHDDLWDPPGDTKAKVNAENLERNWKKEMKSREARISAADPETVRFVEEKPGEQGDGNKTENKEFVDLLRALMATFGCQYFLAWPLLILIECIIKVVQPWFMLLLIRSFIEESVDHAAQYIYATGVVISTLLLTLLNNPCQFYMSKIGQQCRIALTSLIQRKLVKISAGGRGKQTDEGQITNLASNDAAQIENNIGLIPYLIVAPLQLGAFMTLLGYEFGWSSWAGVGFIVVYMPFQYWNGTLSSKYRGQIGQKTDERARLLTELIEAIQTVKMYAWEEIFKNIVQQKRKAEVKELRKRSCLHAFQMSIFLTSSRIVPFLTFAVFVLGGGPLTADRVFFALAVYNTVTHYMVFMLPGGIRALGEVQGSLQRLQKYLLQTERPQNETRYKASEGTPPAVNLSNVTATWNQGSSPVLSEISCDLQSNKFVMIVGKVGSGKSSLLHLILNELSITGGTAQVRGKLSYAAQESYIFPASIKQNILLHNTFNEDKYNKVIQGSGLSQDITELRKGDQTKATGLSGGQKARVNLARALYHSADIYLLDDPISAVDTGTGKHIVESLKSMELLQGKLRILVTHQLQHLSEADHVIVIDGGRIVIQGLPTDQRVEHTVNDLLGKKTESADVDSTVQGGAIQKTVDIGQDDTSVEMEDTNDDEELGAGNLGLKIYWEYFRSGKSNAQLFSYLMIFLIAQLFTTLIEYWLALWTNAEERMYEDARRNTTYSGTTTVDPIDSFDEFVKNLDSLEQHHYLYTYLALTIAVFLTNLAKAVAFFYFTMRISTNIHEKMLASLVRAQPKFFDDNNPGRLMNRFTRDVATIDELIPFQFFDMFTILLQVVTVIVLIIFAIWYSVVAVILFLLALGYVRGYYVTTSRDLKRIDGTSRSPVISHIQSSFSGLITVRALNAEGRFIDQFDYLQDRNTSATISFLAASQCFNIWIETLATMLLAVVAFGFLIAQNYFGMEFLGGNVGLAICSAMSLTIWLQYGMKVSANVENLMVSVERALSYTKLDPEADTKSSNDNIPPTEWPTSGKIQFSKVFLSYDGSQQILRDLSFDIGAKQKIGVVGKTGAGKSSILRALFRMTEINGGSIVIDDLNTFHLGLHDLREKIAVIPQQPQLFKGTIEFNLNPSMEVRQRSVGAPPANPDLKRRMEQILHKIGLQKPLGFEVETKGQNLAFGERQLVSLARALITKHKIVCMDEATAHIDSGTDQRIQETLRKELGSCTVITIAHRLGTIIESDKILVLSEGRVKEYGHAHELLQKEDGLLTTMVNNSGKDATALKQRAQQAWEKRKAME